MVTIRNHDILGLVRRINRFIVEIANAQTAGISGVRTADLERLKEYSAALTTYKTWIVAQPELDLPETHPTDIEIPGPPPLPAIESESVNDVITMLERLRDELVASQSARLATGLMRFDGKRFDAIVDKVNKFITDYIETTTPLDLPESSPTATG